MQPNRLERSWEKMAPKIINKWDRLTKYDLDRISGDFDGLVEAIRKAYSPTRSKLSIEAEIRDWIIARIAEIEMPVAKTAAGKEGT